MQPWPTAFTSWHRREGPAREPLRLIVSRTAVVEGRGAPGEVITSEADRLIIAAGEGAVRLITVQPPGKKPMPAADFLRGNRVATGDLMGGPESWDASVG